MPYLTAARKRELGNGEDGIKTPGDLNYALTKRALRYAEERGLRQFEYDCGVLVREFLEANGGFNYTSYNNAVGALVCARLEWERRSPRALRPEDRSVLTEVSTSFKNMVTLLYDHHIAPYEDLKIEENGDVYP